MSAISAPYIILSVSKS